MKKLLYILVVMVFFNLSVWLLYYLGLVSNTSLIIFDNILDIVITNCIVVFILSIYVIIYNKFLINRFNYWEIALIGIVVGSIISLFLNNITMQEKLFLICFSSFSFTFLSYDIYFDKVKKDVFK